MVKVSWAEDATNEKVMQRAFLMNEKVLQDMKLRRLSYLGHALSGEKYANLYLILEGKME